MKMLSTYSKNYRGAELEINAYRENSSKWEIFPMHPSILALLELLKVFPQGNVSRNCPNDVPIFFLNSRGF